jgi:hypothetical protein
MNGTTFGKTLLNVEVFSYALARGGLFRQKKKNGMQS